MSGKDTIRYFNFPIQLLTGFLDDPAKSLKNMLDYALYKHSLAMEYGSELDKLIASAGYFNVKLGYPKDNLKNGKELYNKADQKSPKVGINLKIFWDFYKNDKPEFDKVCLLAFLALKSIIQKKSYCKIDNKFWLARMDGKPRSCEYAELSANLLKYANEYQTKKIKTALKLGWGLVTYSRYTRGFYISFTMSMESMILEAEKRRRSTKEKQYKKQEEAAVTMALARLGVTRS